MDEIVTNTLQGKITTLQAELQEARERIAALHVTHEVAKSLTTELKLQPLLQRIMVSAVEVMNASAGALILLDPLTDELVFKVAEKGGGERIVGQRMPRNQGIAGWVATHQESLIVDDVEQDNRHYRLISEVVSYHVKSILCVPMVARNKLIGVLQILHDKAGRYFNKLDEQLLVVFASQAAIAIENARLHEALISERDNLILVEEEVRKRLARDLHDGPTQLVSSIIMSLDFIKKLRLHHPDMVDDELAQTSKIAKRAVKQLRTLLFDLRPVILETKGLIPALQLYAQRLREMEPFEVYVFIDEPFPQLQPKVEVIVFAVIQEAVNNAKKYAESTCIKLILRPNFTDDCMTVLVRDNGIGFDVQTVHNRYEERGSLGLLNSRERAQTINGSFSIHSDIGQGTTVTLTFPISENLL